MIEELAGKGVDTTIFECSALIASGGAGEPDHLAEVLAAGADAALCASIFHYGHYTIAETKARVAAAGVPVRR